MTTVEAADLTYDGFCGTVGLTVVSSNGRGGGPGGSGGLIMGGSPGGGPKGGLGIGGAIIPGWPGMLGGISGGRISDGGGGGGRGYWEIPGGSTSGCKVERGEGIATGAW